MPLPEALPGLFADWERHVNDPAPVPPLVRAAMMHYQFETTHPFLDGNGRIGRLVVGLLLQQEGRLTTPLLSLSGYLESHRREYFVRLQAVHERGDVQSWLQFFLTAVLRQAEDGVERAGTLVALREQFLAAGGRTRSRVGELIALIMANPFLTTGRVEGALGVTTQGARKPIGEAERLGWVAELPGAGRCKYWLARQVFDTIEAPPTYARPAPAAETADGTVAGRPDLPDGA